MRQKSGNLYEFGPFVLDTAQHLLLRQGNPVALTPKTYDMLLVLVENSGRMLTKDELMKALWPNSFVEESNLTQQVSMIRKALGESAGEDRYIVTVPGRGYRFAAEVKEREDQRVTEPVAAPTKPGRRKEILIAVLGLLVVGGAVLGYFAYRKQVNGSRRASGPRSLAILPFQSLREDPNNGFLGFSLADAVITKLGYVSSITVRPSSSIERYRNRAIDSRKVAEELHVDALLTGNFLRDGNDLRITSQLIDVKNDNILWRGAFDLKYDRLLTVQDSVAQEIIKGLQLSLSPGEAARLRPDKRIDPLAYEYYLRGVDLYSQDEFTTATKMLLKSTEIDSSYALTWAHLGRSYTANASFELGGREEYRKAQSAYERALSLQPELIEADVYMANLLTDTGRVEGAVPLLRKALLTNPNHAEVHWELGYAYRFGGMLKESAAECEQARRLDPGVKLSSSALNTYLYLGEYDKFLDSLPKVSDSSLMLFYRGFAKYYKKDWNGAAQDLDGAFELRPSLLQARVGKALAHAVRKQNPKGLQILHETERQMSQRGVGDPEAMYKIAQAYAVLGDKVSALREFRSSVDNGFFPHPYFATDPLLDTLRQEGEFTRLMGVARQRHEAFQRKFF